MVKVVRRLGNKNFSNLKDLEKYIQTQIDKVLVAQVSEVIKDELESSISDEVYAKHEPSQYIRRGIPNNIGGLADKSTMHHNLISSGVLEVTPDADFNHVFAMNYARPKGYGDIDLNKSLAENIEFGYGSKTHDWDKPRPFVEKTRENLRSNKNHIESLKDGLEDIFGKGNVI
jgi:hypothetical protein